MSSVMFAFACGIEEWSKFLCPGDTETVTTESPLLNVNFVVEMTLTSELYGQIQHPTMLKYHIYNKNRSGRGEKERRVINKYL